MSSILNFDQMFTHLRQLGRIVRIAVVDGIDASTIEALQRALSGGFAKVLFVGKCPDLEEHPTLGLHPDRVVHVPERQGLNAAETAVALIREGEADFLMKGLIHTSELLRAVLHKEHGLLPQGEVLTHIAVSQTQTHGKLLFFTDSAVLPEPNEAQRERQIDYAVAVTKAFGIPTPRIALTHFTEEVSEKFPLTLHYRQLAERARRGEWGNVIVDGPLDVRTSVDPVALAVKGITSPIEGRADVLIFPNLEAGNTFYKTLSFFGSAPIAGILCGAKCPVVVNSRGDDASSKFYSLAFAATVVAQS